MENFQIKASKIIDAMEKQASKLQVKGVILVNRMDKNGHSWESFMKAVDIIKKVPDNPEGHSYPGYNYIGIAYSKAAEMADTKLNSGSEIRSPYQGEFGYPGGAIKKINSGYLLTVFSGATGEQDFEIAQAGISAYSE